MLIIVKVSVAFLSYRNYSVLKGVFQTAVGYSISLERKNEVETSGGE